MTTINKTSGTAQTEGTVIGWLADLKERFMDQLVERVDGTETFQTWVRLVGVLGHGISAVARSVQSFGDFRTYVAAVKGISDASTTVIWMAFGPPPLESRSPALARFISNPKGEIYRVWGEAVAVSQGTYLDAGTWIEDPIRAIDSLATSAGSSLPQGILMVYGAAPAIGGGMTIGEFATSTANLARTGARAAVRPIRAVGARLVSAAEEGMSPSAAAAGVGSGVVEMPLPPRTFRMAAAGAGGVAEAAVLNLDEFCAAAAKILGVEARAIRNAVWFRCGCPTGLVIRAVEGNTVTFKTRTGKKIWHMAIADKPFAVGTPVAGTPFRTRVAVWYEPMTARLAEKLGINLSPKDNHI